MQPILILQHQTAEHPAYLRAWLDRHGISWEIRDAGCGDSFPTNIAPYAALAVLGGGMSANDPLISNREAEILILQAMRWDRPVIGHCLGGQLMSRALGARIGPSRQPEIGWQPIDYDEDAMVRHWIGAEPARHVIHWHYDCFDLPVGAQRLATSRACENQAWAMGPHLAMQFHIEINQRKVQEWVQDPDDQWAAVRQQHSTVQDRDDMLEDTDRHLAAHQRMADAIYRRWLSTTAWADQILHPA